MTIFAGDDLIPVPYSFKQCNPAAYQIIRDSALAKIERIISDKCNEIDFMLEPGTVRVVKGDALKTVVFSNLNNSIIASVVKKSIENAKGMATRSIDTCHVLLSIIS